MSRLESGIKYPLAAQCPLGGKFVGNCAVTCFSRFHVFNQIDNPLSLWYTQIELRE